MQRQILEILKSKDRAIEYHIEIRNREASAMIMSVIHGDVNVMLEQIKLINDNEVRDLLYQKVIGELSQELFYIESKKGNNL